MFTIPTSILNFGASNVDVSRTPLTAAASTSLSLSDIAVGTPETGKKALLIVQSHRYVSSDMGLNTVLVNGSPATKLFSDNTTTLTFEAFVVDVSSVSTISSFSCVRNQAVSLVWAVRVITWVGGTTVASQVNDATHPFSLSPVFSVSGVNLLFQTGDSDASAVLDSICAGATQEAGPQVWMSDFSTRAYKITPTSNGSCAVSDSNFISVGRMLGVGIT